MYGMAMDTRERLVESTRALLWERGYVGTSPAAILDRAQVGQGSMYHYFRGKSDLAQAAMERTADEMKRQIAADMSAPGTAFRPSSRPTRAASSADARPPQRREPE